MVVVLDNRIVTVFIVRIQNVVVIIIIVVIADKFHGFRFHIVIGAGRWRGSQTLFVRGRAQTTATVSVRSWIYAFLQIVVVAVGIIIVCA